MSDQPRFVVGVSGHRPNRMHVGAAEIVRRMRWVLAALRSGSRGGARIAVSPLAEGSDRIFARAALELGYRLEALLPFESADYETTFGDPSETPDYRSLLAQAAEVTMLGGTLDNTKAAYEAVGRASVESANVLVAVWDGEGAAGRGGTPEIMDFAVRAGKPVIWIDAARLRMPRLIAMPGAHGPRDLPLDTLAARARPLTRTALARLVDRIVSCSR